MNMQSEKKHSKEQQVIFPSAESVDKVESTSVLKDQENGKDHIETSDTEPNAVLGDLEKDETKEIGKQFITNNESSDEDMEKVESQQNLMEEINVPAENNEPNDDIPEMEETLHNKERKPLFDALLNIVARIDEIAEKENIDLVIESEDEYD